MTLGLHVYSTCPHRLETGGATYAAAVADAAVRAAPHPMSMALNIVDQFFKVAWLVRS